MDNVIRTPDCITDVTGNNKHTVVSNDDGNKLFMFRCQKCFERFALVSETVLKELADYSDIIYIPKGVGDDR